MMANPYQAASITKGLANVAKYEQGRDLRESQLAEAKSRRQLADTKLQEYQANAPVRKTEAELRAAKAEQQLYTVNAQMLEQQTYDSFQRYDADGDTKHLNYFLQRSKSNPLAHAAKNISRISSLAEARSSETDNLLRQSGVTDIEGAYNNEDFAKSHLVATGIDGKQRLIDYNVLKGSTRYNQYATKEQLAIQERQARVAQMMRSGNSASKVEQLDSLVEEIMKDGTTSKVDAYRKAKGILDGSASTSDERMINRIVEEQGIGILEATKQFYGSKRGPGGQTNESQYIESYMQQHPDASRTEATSSYKNLAKTAKSKDVAEVNDIRDSLDEFKYLETSDADLTPTQKAQANRKVFDLIKLGGYDLGQEEKRALRGLRQMLTFGGTVEDELTSEQTGIFDTIFNKVKSYISDNVEGKAATAAYESFRNVLRHDLFGATVPEGEMAAFNASVGTLGTQTGPVLAKMREQILGMKAKIQSIADTNEPYVARAFLGKDLEGVEDLIQRLDQRLATLPGGKKYSTPNGKPILSSSSKVKEISSTAKHEPGSERPSLESLFGAK